MKVLCFHPSIAPYRIEFFNHLAARCDFSMVFLDVERSCSKFDLESCLKRLKFSYRFLENGFKFMGRFVRTGILASVRKENPDVVISYEYSWVTLLLAIYRMVGCRRYRLYTMTDDNPEIIAAYRPLRKRLCQFVCLHLDGMIVTGQRTAAAFRTAYRMKKDFKFGVVPIIHDADEYAPVSDEVHLRAATIRKEFNIGHAGLALYVGRLTEVKNVAWLIRAMQKILPEQRPQLWLIGDGDQRQALEQLVSNLALEAWIRFVGFLHGNELLAHFATANCLVLPSKYEPYGAVVGEALQWGTPCLVSNFVGAQELITPGVNGDVFGLDEVDAFCTKLVKWSLCKHTHENLLPLSLEKSVDELVSVMATLE